ncbi:MAG: mechanosensitive ion channel family protein [Halodesulfurarchaeum sp.]
MIPAQGTTGPIGDLLSEAGIPYAALLGSAAVFVIVFTVVAIVGRAVIQPLINRGMDRRGLDEHAKRPIRRIAKAIVLFVAIASAFGAAGFTGFLQSLATIAAAGTLAIGFALQDVIKNFVAGVFIYTDKPFRIGDWIEWDTYDGIVEDISLRVTRVRTFNNELLTVPNSQLTDGVIKNPVEAQQLRRTFTFGIGYEDDIEKATEIILDKATAHDGIMEDPGPSVRVTSLGDSAVDLQARFWIADPSRSDFIKTTSEFVQSTKTALEEAGINIPYPQRDLHGELTLEEDLVDTE